MSRIKRAVKGFIDPITTKVEDWKWRPLADVDKELKLKEVPDYIQSGYGGFMADQLKRAEAGDLNARDLIKAYTITQSSIGRGGLSHATATKAGLRLPNTGGEVRPEGAFAEWLGSPLGQRYLDMAERGELDSKALKEIQAAFAPFGKQNDQVAKMEWAAQNLPGMAVDLNTRVTGPLGDWRNYTDELRGIAAAKSGFVGSLLGRGDVPTLDARQLNLHGTTPPVGLGSIQNRGGGTGGRELVDRLTARQEALGLKLDPSLDPFYQHLGHHAVWDKIGNTETTHEDLVRAMRDYNKGGAVHMADGGMINSAPEEAIKNTIRDPQAFKMLDMDLANLALMNQQPQKMAGGGVARMAGGGIGKKAASSILGKGFKTLEDEIAARVAANTVKAGDRAAAGRAAAAQIAAQPELPMSEALGNLNAEGKRLIATQADRTRVGGGNIGGPAFSAISLADPNYADMVWGVGKKSTASGLINQNDPRTIWTTLLGSQTQLKTNPIVFAKLEKEFRQAMKEGKLSPELEAKINHNLALTFGEGADIRDPNIWKAADSFERRAALSDIMIGEGIAPGKGGVALGGAKKGKGVIFDPLSILTRETEPSLRGDVPTFSLGPRLFTLSGETSFRPDLHPGFPTLLHGEDLGAKVRPVPNAIALPDYHAEFARRNPTRDPSYYDLTKGFKGEGLPSQTITEEWLSHLQKEGHKDGGVIHMKDGGKTDEDLFALKPQPKPAIPTVRELVAEIGKNPARYEAKYPPKDATPVQMQAYQLMQAARKTPDANRYLESLNPYFDSQLRFDIGAGSDAGYVKFKEPNIAVMQKLEDVKNTIPHELTHTLQLGKGANVNLEGDRQVMQRAQGLPAAMQQSVLPSDNRFENMKEVWANVNARAHEVNAAGGDFINSPEGRALFPTPELQREYYTKSMPSVNSMTPSTGTFVPNKAEGGAVKPPPVFAQAQVPFEEVRHQLGMKRGGIPHFDEGGEVSQSELDRMRFEIAQQQNPTSPVMQATPRGAMQDFIGTFGGYMDKAGKFISESIEPTAEKHPVKNFLANMFLADPLKGAGTLMQDLTGTVRETDEDNPVRGIIDKDWRKLSTGTEPLLDPRVLDIAQFGGPAAKAATKVVRTGAKAITPFAKNTAEMAAELYSRGQMPGMVAPNAFMAEPSAPKPAKVLAPANEQGFYSPTEAAALNLQRKSGSGQALLNDILKGENVRSDEVSAMGLDTFLKDKKNVTAAEVQDYIAQNKLQLGDRTYRAESVKWGENESGETVTENLPNPYTISNEYGKTYITNSDNITVSTPFKNEAEAKRYIEEMARDDALLPNDVKWAQWSLPGGENYREVVLTLPEKPKKQTWEWFDPETQESKSGFGTQQEAYDARPSISAAVSKIETPDSPQSYRSSHFDEPNILAHLRMSDRVTDGKKTLLVDEVQSDWHQAGRERGYKGDKIDTTGWEVETPYFNKPEDVAIYDARGEEVWAGKSKGTDNQTIEKAVEELQKKQVSQAPYKDDWYQLALKRAVKEAIDGGYDRVALPTGARVAERFGLGNHIDRIDYNQNPDGTYTLSAIKNHAEVFSKEDISEKELSDLIGKDVAKKIVADEGKPYYSPAPYASDETDIPEFKSLSGLDLLVGGKGMKKYYDEIYPSYLQKFGKKYGASVGKTTVDADGVTEPLHYMDITPAMRKEFSTGIHMKKGGKVSFAPNVDAMRHELTKAK